MLFSKYIKSVCLVVEILDFAAITENIMTVLDGELLIDVTMKYQIS